MNTPEITVTAEPAKLPERLRAAVLTTLGKADADLFVVTVTCPHGQRLQPAALPTLESTGPEILARPRDELRRAAVNTLCQRIRELHLQIAPCPCSEPHWLRHGPFLATTIEGAACAIELHDDVPCRN